MTEEIKDDNNCIVKAFENNPIAILHEDINSKKIYYFKASDIGKALGIVNIRSTIQNYDDDERVVRNVYDPQGTPQDTIFLSSQGVYRLLYTSKKEVAKKFRKWAGNILDDIIFNESAELKRQLEEKEKQHQIELQENEKMLLEKETLLKESSKELLRTKKQLEIKTKLKVKKWYDSEPGHTIYAVKSNKDDDNSLVTIGKTKNIKDRERNYFTHNQNAEMFYIKKCYNCDLAEQVIHHILDKHREEHNKDESTRFDSFAWFNVSNKLAIYTIDIVCDFLDKFINYSEELPKSNIKENFDVSLELIKNLSTEIKIPIENNLEIKQNKAIDTDYNDPTDFDKFVKEYCELGDTEEYFTSPYDLLGAFRMWCRGALCTTDIRHRFSVYMKEKFVFKDKFIADYGSRFQIYVGIRPKKLEFQPENQNKLKTYEEFFNNKCHVGYTFRIRYTTFIYTYKEWLNNTYPNNIYTKDHEIELKAYFNKKFLITTLPGIKSIGLWGCQLKTDEAPKYGLQTRKKKIVLQIDDESKKITNTYESLIEASEKLKISNRTLWDYIKKSKVFEFENKKILLKYHE